jgi:hypothetical protein
VPAADPVLRALDVDVAVAVDVRLISAAPNDE